MVQPRKRHGRHFYNYYNWKAIVVKNRWKMIFMLLSIAGVSVQLFQYPPILPLNGERSNDPYLYLMDTTTILGPPSEDSQRAIFLISMGQAAATGKIVERCLLSIRRRGNWNGYVVLMTDAPPERYLPSETQDEHFIVMHPRPQDFKWGNEINDVPYKRFKMMQLKYLDLDPRLSNIELVYYLDIDIVVGAPLVKFFNYTEEKYSILGNKRMDTSVSKAFFFKGNFAEYPLQGGQFVLERRHSQGHDGKDCSWRRNKVRTRRHGTITPFILPQASRRYAASLKQSQLCHIESFQEYRDGNCQKSRVAGESYRRLVEHEHDGTNRTRPGQNDSLSTFRFQMDRHQAAIHTLREF
jgi:hypothetical protein